MPGVCGIACEICAFHKNELCPGCPPGNDPKAPVFVETLKGLGISCAVLECAIKNKVDHCFRCTEFPCDVHYLEHKVFAKELLDTWKKFMGK